MNRVEIIAEIGVNHDGSIAKAKNLITVAKECGADYAKFQFYDTENLVVHSHKKAQYQLRANDGSNSHFDMLKKYQLRIDDLKELHKFADSEGIGFMLSAFDLQSVKMALEFKLPYYKIPSGEITNQLSLEFIGSINQSIIISTGMSYLSEIDECLASLVNHGQDLSKVTLLHCSSEYPADNKNLNLNALTLLKERFNTTIGFSDHTQDINAGILSVALGASIIEKHITLDKNYPGPDHPFSIEPDELKQLVIETERAWQSLGKVSYGLMKMENEALPNILRYSKHSESDSMLNTPPTFSWYMAGKVFKWIKKSGGLDFFHEQNHRKASSLYAYIDNSSFYTNPVSVENRSIMNIPFILADSNLATKFLEEAEQEGLLNLKGHRSVGGMRASIYNAMPVEGVNQLIDFMKVFEAKYG